MAGRYPLHSLEREPSPVRRGSAPPAREAAITLDTRAADSTRVIDTPHVVDDPQVIDNPLSGERIVIHEAASGPGARLAWELRLAPGGRVPSSHAHPAQEERFTVVEGRMRFRVGGWPVIAGPGTTVVVPPGTVHSFANAGPDPARVLVTTVPALQMAELLETAAAMAREQHAAGRSLPRLLDLALFMVDFEGEVRAPYLPAAPVRLVMRALARLARTGGLDARYRRLRDRSR